MAAAAVSSRLILLVFFISVVHGRILTLHSSDDHLISDGVDRLVENQSSSTIDLSATSTCDHQYGFLPCSENAAGYIFQIMVYQGLLIFGEKQIGKGSKVLFHIIGAGKFGGIIFRILMALPSMMLMIVSGVFSSKENAQNQVSLGVGIYAGITVFSLTVQWGICVIVGRRDLKEKPNECDEIPHTNCLPFTADTGVAIDPETRQTAGIVLLSLIPYVIVQIVDIFQTSSGNHFITLISLVFSTLSLLSYFLYQVELISRITEQKKNPTFLLHDFDAQLMLLNLPCFLRQILNPWIQERSLDYSRYEMLRTGFLKHVQRQGQLVNEDGKLNTNVVEKLFADTDKDADKCITKDEMEKLVVDVLNTGQVKIDDKFAVAEVMKTFDFDDDTSISEQEFIKGCKKWIDETNQSSRRSDSTSKHVYHEILVFFHFCQVLQLFKEKKENDPREMDKIMSKILKHAETQLLKSESLITPDGKPDIERIQSLFKQFDTDGNKSISASELEQLISTVKFGEFKPKREDIIKELFNDFDKDDNNSIDEREFVEGVKKWLNKAIHVANTPDKTRSIDEFDQVSIIVLVFNSQIVWKKAVHNNGALIVSIFQVVFGIGILTFLGGPLMGSILQLSYAMGLPSFGISFVIVPLAMNARAALTAFLPASQKSERSASLTFSEIYGGVIMNNIAGLTTLLAIVYAKDLTWDFSAEVLTILVVCAIIGYLSYSSPTYPLWTSIVAFFLYPFSMGLCYFVQVYLSWN
ncbi:PREDICTED: uncharacterized protein LOC105968379 [Erythranthe guttata]|uniref:uncharacterized protein LOC105968379 n=1 Tax=Erythranthe guttata TaxID=4155 RepID=UPI00064DD507|nr:PREDICTED: uncharacterized protein LOC105968379 [Erythranthe guttata]|eukprot:XP_012848461.1 PREDICTED: uncharacterized protein LOC105968379 [Erythranthe guttata]